MFGEGIKGVLSQYIISQMAESPQVMYGVTFAMLLYSIAMTLIVVTNMKRGRSLTIGVFGIVMIVSILGTEAMFK